MRSDEPQPPAEGNRLRLLLDERLSEEPEAPPLIELVERCELDVTRHHRTRVFALAAAIVVIASTPFVLAAVVGGFNGSDPDLSISAPAGTSSLKQCNAGNQSADATSQLNASGKPRIVARGALPGTRHLILESADGTVWASCFIHADSNVEVPAGMTVFSTTERADGLHYEQGFACPDAFTTDAEPCSTFFVNYIDRLPEAVSRVGFTTADGQTTKVGVRDGYVLLDYLGNVPTRYSRSNDAPQDWLKRITYFDGVGQKIAAQNAGVSDLDEQRVGDLPLLNSYPSFHAEVGETASSAGI